MRYTRDPGIAENVAWYRAQAEVASLMRVAVSLIGGKDWMGGYNCLLNLFDVLIQYQAALDRLDVCGEGLRGGECAFSSD